VMTSWLGVTIDDVREGLLPRTIVCLEFPQLTVPERAHSRQGFGVHGRPSRVCDPPLNHHTIAYWRDSSHPASHAARSSACTTPAPARSGPSAVARSVAFQAPPSQATRRNASPRFGPVTLSPSVAGSALHCRCLNQNGVIGSISFSFLRPAAS